MFASRLRGGEMSAQDAMDQASGPKQEIAALQAMKQAENERLQISQQRANESLSAANQELQTSQQLLDTEKRRADTIRDQRIGAKERFGQLSPLEQQRLIRIKEKADRGEDLTREQRQAMRGVGLDSTTGIARRGDTAAADRAGYARYFGGEERQAEVAARAKVAELKVDVKAQSELIIKIDTDARRMADLITEKLTQFEARIQETVRREYENQSNRKFRERETMNRAARG